MKVDSNPKGPSVKTALEPERKSFALREVKADVASRIISGYAATWDIDEVGDQVVRGAFEETIKTRGPVEVDGKIQSKIKLYYNHGFIIGIPLKMEEDEKGLYVEARVANTRLGDDVLAMCSDGTLDSMSFSFDVIEHAREKSVRKLLKLKVYEFGPVDFPANEAAAITGVKAGRVLSTSSLTKLDRAIEALTELRASAGDDEEKEEEAEKAVNLSEKTLAKSLKESKSFRDQLKSLTGSKSDTEEEDDEEKDSESDDDESSDEDENVEDAKSDEDEEEDVKDDGANEDEDEEKSRPTSREHKSGGMGEEEKSYPKARDIAARVCAVGETVVYSRWESDAEQKRRDLEDCAVILDECAEKIRAMAAEVK